MYIIGLLLDTLQDRCTVCTNAANTYAEQSVILFQRLLQPNSRLKLKVGAEVQKSHYICV